MEELQSTDVLDQEILEDARKKAQRVLKSAEETIAASTKAWEEKARNDVEKIKESCALRGEKNRKEILARLPLDKRRVYTEKIETLLTASMNAFLGSLSRDKLLAVLEKELSIRAEELIQNQKKDDAPIEISSRDLSGAELKSLLNKTLPGIPWKARKDFPQRNLSGSFPAIVADAPALRLIASVDALAAALTSDRRAELVAALLGPEVMGADQ
jgi:vacuolar-type H+-ATPase subunit H